MKPFIVSLLYDLPLNRKTLAEQRAIKIIPVKPTEVKIPSPRIFSSVYTSLCKPSVFSVFREIQLYCLLVSYLVLIDFPVTSKETKEQSVRKVAQWRRKWFVFGRHTIYMIFEKPKRKCTLIHGTPNKKPY